MKTKNPYDVLGVSAEAGLAEIRSAYLKRTKVLHPDRFDKASQPIEWQMANDMLQELNEAYSELTKRADANHERASWPQPPHSDTEICILLDRTQYYWNEAGRVFLEAVNTSETPFENWNKHVDDLKHSVAASFLAQTKIAQLNTSGVDQMVLTAANEFNEGLVRFSALAAERIQLYTKADALKGKYSPFFKMYWKRLIGTISDKEYDADQKEWKAIDPRLAETANQFERIKVELGNRIEILAIQLVAKYGNSFQA